MSSSNQIFKFLMCFIRGKFNLFDPYYAMVGLLIPVCLALYATTSFHEYDKSLDINSMMSLNYRYILVCEMTIASLLLVEAITDGLSNTSSMFAAEGSLINISILLSLLIGSSTIFFSAIPNNDYYLIFSINETRLLLLVGAISSYSYRYGRYLWRCRFLFLSAFLAGIGCAMKISDAIYHSSLNFAGMVLQAIFTIILGLYFLRWLKYLKSESRKRTITTDEWNCTIYISLGIITILFQWVLINIFNIRTIQDFSYPFLVSVEVTVTSFVVIQFLYQTRVIRRESNKQKEELEFKRMFVRYISHEVRTPLNTAIMGLQVLDEELQGIASDSLETIQDIKTSCDIAVTTLNELLTFDKLEAGTLMVEKAQFDAMNLIEETIHPFQIQARRSKITLKVTRMCLDIENGREIILDADRNKISQIIRNLVSNGLKFTPPGGTVDVTVYVTDGTTVDDRASKLLKLDVMDSGAGISPENQKKLFKEIVQFNPGKLQKGGGSGLGLYISNGIADLHGGSLSVFSKGEGQGCTFTMTLPCVYDERTSPSNRIVSGIYEKTSRVTPSMEMGDNNGDNINNNNSSNSSSRVVPFLAQRSYTASMLSLPKSAVTQASNRRIYTVESDAKYSDNNNNDDDDDNNTNNTSDNDKANNEINIYENGKERNINNNSPKIKVKNPMTVQTSSFFFAAEQKNSLSVKHISTSSPTSNQSKLRMLVVDDSAMNRKMQCRLLRKRCVSCIEAENGQEAVDKVKMAMTGGGDGINPIDLIIMDCNMPVMNGMDAAKVMRDMGYKGFIVGVTGNVSTDDIEDFISHGADVVLAKPLDMEKFDIVVSNLISLHSDNAL